MNSLWSAHKRPALRSWNRDNAAAIRVLGAENDGIPDHFGLNRNDVAAWTGTVPLKPAELCTHRWPAVRFFRAACSPDAEMT